MSKHPFDSIEFDRWLRSVGPDEWHQVAQSWNWDYGTYRLQWLIKQPNCDLGTALMIFWLSDPLHNFTQLNPYRPDNPNDQIYIDLETIGLQITILKRWVKGDFQRSEIAFDGGKIWECQEKYCAPIVPFEVIREMAKPRLGRKIERGEFEEGIPYHIAFPDQNT